MKKTIADIIMPARLLGINRVFHGGREVTKVRLSRHDLAHLPIRHDHAGKRCCATCWRTRRAGRAGVAIGTIIIRFAAIPNGAAMYRTHYISEARKSAGSEVTLAGWVHEVRDLGKLKFVQVRDRSGIIQVTAKAGREPDDVLAAMSVPKETVVSVTGKVAASKIAEAGWNSSPRNSRCSTK